GRGTAGVSLVEPDGQGGTQFRWTVLSGTLAAAVGGTTPRHFSPCGVCLDAGAPVLFSHPERRFAYFQSAGVPFVEGLVLPFAQGTAWEGTIWIVAHDAHRFDAEDVRVMGVLGDLTASVYAQGRALELQRTYAGLGTRPEELLDHLPVGFVTIDPTFRYTYANAEAERFAGMPRGQFVGRNIYEVFPDLRGSVLESAFQQVMAERVVSRFDLPFPLHDTWYELVVHPLDDGGIAVFFNDVKLRKGLEQDAAEAREDTDRMRRLYETIHANTPDFVYVWGPDHKFRYANQALLDLYGVTADKCIGYSFRDLGYPEWIAQMHEREIDVVIATHQPVRGKIPFQGPGGGGIYDYIFVPVFGPDGTVESVAGITRDVTGLERANQALLEADKRKDEFLATLAHELRNPLAPLRNGVELLAMAEDLGDVRQAQGMMRRQVEHMVHLVDDLLDLSRVSRGVIELRRTRNTLHEVISTAVETVRPLMDHHAHQLTVDLPEEELIIDGDTTRLAQIFSNLLNNAAKYTAPGGRIGLKAVREGEGVRVTVSDNGIGIAPGDLHRVFDMFTQVEDVNARARGGLGIGLHIVKRLVDMHGGQIAVASTGLGQGSTFSVSLPLGGQEQAVPPPATDGTAPRRRILIVDDNVDAAFTLSLVLKKKGHDVHATYGAREALDLAATFRPEVILMDIGMPELDGYEACKLLRAMP
ncbi:MAG TPA: PAS domain-containing protein, partial [Flavobacteriales bacterium]|nr:PAS domain-containing protein [Flavobacteriales bacterium]